MQILSIQNFSILSRKHDFFNLLLNDSKVLEDFISLGKEFKIAALLCWQSSLAHFLFLILEVLSSN